MASHHGARKGCILPDMSYPRVFASDPWSVTEHLAMDKRREPVALTHIGTRGRGNASRVCEEKIPLRHMTCKCRIEGMPATADSPPTASVERGRIHIGVVARRQDKM
jgi:hypothetical protein